MLTYLDLTELQSRDGLVVDLSFKRGRVEWIDIELTAKFRQGVGPELDLPLGRQSGGAQGMDGICHDPITGVNRDQNMTPSGVRSSS